MENASKALIIAGGVLIAIIILSIMAYMFSNIEIFKCDKIEYNKSGRISKMVFKHIPKQ